MTISLLQYQCLVTFVLEERVRYGIKGLLEVFKYHAYYETVIKYLPPVLNILISRCSVEWPFLYAH